VAHDDQTDATVFDYAMMMMMMMMVVMMMFRFDHSKVDQVRDNVTSGNRLFRSRPPNSSCSNYLNDSGRLLLQGGVKSKPAKF